MNILDLNEPLPPWAIAKSNGNLVKGLQLLTKDGRRHGNAIIIDIYDRHYLQESYTIFECITDMGNIIRKTASEIDASFYLGDYIMDVDEACKIRERNDD